jgi:hypothetical protein
VDERFENGKDSVENDTWVTPFALFIFIFAVLSVPQGPQRPNKAVPGDMDFGNTPVTGLRRF